MQARKRLETRIIKWRGRPYVYRITAWFCSYFLREHHVHSTGKEIKLRPKFLSSKNFHASRVGVNEGVTETIKAEQNKAGVRMHMLEAKRRKGPHLVRDFYKQNDVQDGSWKLKLGLKSAKWFQQTRESQLSRLSWTLFCWGGCTKQREQREEKNEDRRVWMERLENNWNATKGTNGE